MNTKAAQQNRFDDASRYAAFLESPEGRLRMDLAFANLQDLLPASGSVPLRVLDIGCGTGATSVRLARLGFEVTLVDTSKAMLEFAERAVVHSGMEGKVTIRQGNADKVAEMFPAGSFDVVLCHNLLEYVDDPAAVLRGAARIMRGSSAVLSVLVRNQAGEVLKAAICGGDLAAAEHNLKAEWGQESLYGGKVRLFTPDSLEAMIRQASLEVSARRGVRVLSDYLPVTVSRSAEYDQIFDLERKLGVRPEFYGAARYLQCLASTSEENK